MVPTMSKIMSDHLDTFNVTLIASIVPVVVGMMGIQIFFLRQDRIHEKLKVFDGWPL